MPFMRIDKDTIVNFSIHLGRVRFGAGIDTRRYWFGLAQRQRQR